MRNLSYLMLAAIFVVGIAAESRTFRNAYVAFELPDNWDCSLQATEWVCRSQDAQQAREAIIILTAKEVGPTDTFRAYHEHLNTVKNVSTRTGASVQSQIVYQAKDVNINQHRWVDGMHLGSEIPNYYTRYLATIKDRIAILVTFSAHRAHYTKYTQDFFRAVQSLRVIASSNLLARPQGGPTIPGQGTLGGAGGSLLPSDPDALFDVALPSERRGGNPLRTLLFGLALLLVGIGGYLYWKSRKAS